MRSAWFLTILLLTSFTAGQTFTELLRSHDDLSQWYRLIKPSWSSLSLSNVTMMVPNNDAVTAYFRTPQLDGCVFTDLDMLRASVYYHTVQGTWPNATLFQGEGMVYFTMLVDAAYSPARNNSTWFIAAPPSTIFTSSGKTSNLTGKSWIFDSGAIHVVDSVLQLPLSTMSLLLSNGFHEAAGLFLHTQSSELLEYKALGMFAPTDEAFEAVYSNIKNYSSSDFMDLAKYHLLNGSGFADQSDLASQIPTLQGNNITWDQLDNPRGAYINNAYMNGFTGILRGKTVHAFRISQVLNPFNATAPRNSTAWPTVPRESGRSDDLAIFSVPTTKPVVLCKNPLLSDDRPKTPVIAGIVIGIVVFICLVFGSIFLRRRRLRAGMLPEIDLKSELQGDRPRTELGLDGEKLRAELLVQEKAELSNESQKNELRAIDIKELQVEPARTISELPAYQSAAEYTSEMEVTSFEKANSEHDDISKGGVDPKVARHQADKRPGRDDRRSEAM